MKKHTADEIRSLLGVTPVSTVTDMEIWDELISPMTKGLLGHIVDSKQPVVMETVDGNFVGDSVTNLNRHKLYGDREDLVRVRYIYSSHKTEFGFFIVKRDGVKVEAFCWRGEPVKGSADLILKVGLRDRRFDGTERANDCSLLDYPYHHPVFHRPIDPKLQSVEVSIYGFLPRTTVDESDGDSEYAEFYRNPYKFVHDPDKFLKHFRRAWKGKRAPGQVGAPVEDVSKTLLPAAAKLLARYGYDFVEGTPSYMHVAHWIRGNGYKFLIPEQAEKFLALMAGIEKIKASGIKLNRVQESWVVVLQSLRPADRIPPELHLGGPAYPQDNVTDEVVWMYFPLTDAAKAWSENHLSKAQAPDGQSTINTQAAKPKPDDTKK